MKLARFSEEGRTRIGVVDGEQVVDLEAACPELPREMTELLAAGPAVLERARKAAQDGGAPRFALESVRLEAPIARPPKFLGVGLNYADHAAETGRNPPEFPVFFNKQSTCVIGPGVPIVLPRVSEQVDYEGELGLVIGRRARRLSREQAREAIAGYLVVNDVSARDWQFRAPTMTLGKSFDTHGPIGPWIVTADEVGDPHVLELRTYVSGELRQHSNTRNLIFDCYALVELLSTVFTLEPGDIVSTGTPAGVGMAASPQRFLRPGDVVRIEIERIGVLENPVIAEA
ncbi:MAG: FAA hydrolase family protein [Deltaproteobacteria bacterium]|nr:MAG: FAA hydrolase family protein [Deltaproteobacteria bacterium]